MRNALPDSPNWLNVFDAETLLTMTPEELAEMDALLPPATVKVTYCPHPASPRQTAFLSLNDEPEVLYGGAAGGGKTDALLMAALQYVDQPGYAALLLQKTYADLSKPGCLMPRSHEWLNGLAEWSGELKQWRFPSGAVLQFGHLGSETDKYNYKSSEFQFIGFDELTQFTETQYTFLFSRLRRLRTSAIPTRMRAATNPGGPGHEWVKKRFEPHKGPSRRFVPAYLEDNPGLDIEDYEKQLNQLDHVTRAQLRRGDWSDFEGGRFRSKWFRSYRWKFPVPDMLFIEDWSGPIPLGALTVFVVVDPASRAKEANDYTVILALGVWEGRLFVLHVVRERLTIDEIIPRLGEVVNRWKPDGIGIEANGFQLALVKEARKKPWGFAVAELDPEGKDKLARALPAIIAAEHGQVYLPESADWLGDFLAELVQYTGDDKVDPHDDQVDALAYAVQMVQDYLDNGAGWSAAPGAGATKVM
jgi:predicted phage terminase large subunit-like protein